MRRRVDADGTRLDTIGAIDVERAVGTNNGWRKLTVAAPDDQITPIKCHGQACAVASAHRPVGRVISRGWVGVSAQA